MNIQDLVQFLKQKNSVFDIKDEVYEWKKCKEKKGACCSIYIKGYEDVLFDKNIFVSIVSLYVDGVILDDELDYVLSGLILLYHSEELLCEFSSEEFAEDFFDILYEITEPDINGKITREGAKSVINRLDKLMKG